MLFSINCVNIAGDLGRGFVFLSHNNIAILHPPHCLGETLGVYCASPVCPSVLQTRRCGDHYFEKHSGGQFLLCCFFWGLFFCSEMIWQKEKNVFQIFAIVFRHTLPHLMLPDFCMMILILFLVPELLPELFLVLEHALQLLLMQIPLLGFFLPAAVDFGQLLSGLLVSFFRAPSWIPLHFGREALLPNGHVYFPSLSWKLQSGWVGLPYELCSARWSPAE